MLEKERETEREREREKSEEAICVFIPCCTHTTPPKLGQVILGCLGSLKNHFIQTSVNAGTPGCDTLNEREGKRKTRKNERAGKTERGCVSVCVCKRKKREAASKDLRIHGTFRPPQRRSTLAGAQGHPLRP